MALSATKLADRIAEKRLKESAKSYESLRSKCIEHINEMSADMLGSIEVNMDDKELVALGKITDELRDLGYKFAYIEVENPSGNILKRKLRISLEHLL